tara:strand:+ start:2167 stop:2787 length:621 start_codon:yes stop_codon:yes gene_type:complete
MLIFSEELKNKSGLNYNKHNGRINLLDNVNIKFSLQDKIQVTDNSCDYREALNGGWEKNLLSDVFFCKENINIIQNGIRGSIYDNTEKVIGLQPIDQIKIIMRSIYLQNAKNIADDISYQVGELNKQVIRECVCKIMTELNSYLKYKRDISNMAVPIDRPRSTYINQSLEWKGHFKKQADVVYEKNNISKFLESNVEIRKKFKPLV